MAAIFADRDGFEMNATLFQVCDMMFVRPSYADAGARGRCMSRMRRCSLNYPADEDRFIEENHEYKLKSHARQSASRPAPGRPSQDMMSFWGISTVPNCRAIVNKP
jgi:RAT1-interacting protein